MVSKKHRKLLPARPHHCNADRWSLLLRPVDLSDGRTSAQLWQTPNPSPVPNQGPFGCVCGCLRPAGGLRVWSEVSLLSDDRLHLSSSSSSATSALQPKALCWRSSKQPELCSKLTKRKKEPGRIKSWYVQVVSSRVSVRTWSLLLSKYNKRFILVLLYKKWLKLSVVWSTSCRGTAS